MGDPPARTGCAPPAGRVAYAPRGGTDPVHGPLLAPSLPNQCKDHTTPGGTSAPPRRSVDATSKTRENPTGGTRQKAVEPSGRVGVSPGGGRFSRGRWRRWGRAGREQKRLLAWQTVPSLPLLWWG